MHLQEGDLLDLYTCTKLGGMKVFHTCLLLVLFFKSFAQIDSLAAENLAKKAGEYLSKGEKDSAAILHQQALGYYLSNDLPYGALRSYRVVYEAKNWKGSPIELLDTFIHQMELERRPPRTHNENAILCGYILNIGFLFEIELNDLSSARYYYEQAYSIYQFDLAEKNDAIASFIYHKLGNIYTRLGDYGRSKALLKKKLSYGTQYNIPKMLEGYSDLALVYFEEESLDSARIMVLKEIDLPNSSVESRFGALNILASYWLRKGIPNKADSVLALSKLQLEKLENKCSRKDFLKHKASWLGIMGKTKEDAGLLADALAFYMQEIAAYLERSNGVLKERELGKVHVKVSDLLLKMHNPSDALVNVQKALQCVMPNFSPTGIENPEASQLYAENTIIEALEQKARVLTAMGKTYEALSCYEMIPLVEAKLRFYYQYEASSFLLLKESRTRIENAISMAQQAYKKTGDSKYAEAAFSLSEQARGCLMIEAVLNLDAQTYLPDEVKQKQWAVRSKMAWLERQIANLPKNKKEEAKALENQLFLLKQQNAAIQESLANDVRLGTSIPQNPSNSLSIAEAHQILRPLQALLSYFFVNDTLHVFFIGPGNNAQVLWRSEVIPKDFFPNLTDLVENLGNKNQSPAAVKKTLAALYKLYQLLLSPELENYQDSLNSLLVIPDKTLSFLPLEVLLDKPPKSGQGFANSDFLVKKYSFSYLTSASFASLHKKRNERKKSLRKTSKNHDELLPFAGFAPKYDSETDSLVLVHRSGEVDSNLFKLNRLGLYDLPGAREEVRKIQDIAGGDYYLGDSAQKDVFMKNAHKYQILHLAMHALPNRKNPSLGTMFFSQNNGTTSTDDFTLYANELSALELNADLAVLSACSTGEGVWKSGEGVYSLARFFLLAGVPSVVMSLWRLPDQSASEIMVSFYAAMKAGKEKDEALQAAKLAFWNAHQTDQDQLHPFFWSGIVLTGQ